MPHASQTPKPSLNDLAVRVRDRTPDWEAAWEHLIGALLPQLQRFLGAKSQQIPGGEQELNDAIGAVLLYWQKRVSAGTLLRYWRSDSVPVAGYLCNRAAIHIARNYARECLGTAVGGDDGMFAMDTQYVSTVTDTDERRATASTMSLPGQGACYFLPLPESGVGKLQLMAAVQLFAHINWRQDPAPAVAQALPNYLSGVDETDWRETLVAAHSRAQARLAQREQAKLDALSNDGKGVSPRQQKVLQAQIIKVRSEQYIRPLDANELMRLTGAARNSCDQDRSRFARKWQTVVAWVDDHPPFSRDDSQHKAGGAA